MAWSTTTRFWPQWLFVTSVEHTAKYTLLFEKQNVIIHILYSQIRFTGVILKYNYGCICITVSFINQTLFAKPIRKPKHTARCLAQSSPLINTILRVFCNRVLCTCHNGIMALGRIQYCCALVRKIRRSRCILREEFRPDLPFSIAYKSVWINSPLRDVLRHDDALIKAVSKIYFPHQIHSSYIRVWMSNYTTQFYVDMGTFPYQI